MLPRVCNYFHHALSNLSWFVSCPEGVLISSVLHTGLLHCTDTRGQCYHTTIHVKSPPDLWLIYLEGMRELSTSGPKPGCNTWIPQREEWTILFFEHHSSFTLSAVQLLLSPHVPWREKPGIPLSGRGAPRLVVGAASCCDGCLAVLSHWSVAIPVGEPPLLSTQT